jgi:hypothetical protein
MSRRVESGLADDPTVPRRDELVDGAFMAARLAELLGDGRPARLERCEVARTKYKVGESLRVVYRVSVGGADHLVTARTFPPGRARDVFAREAGRAASPGPLRPVAVDESLEAVFLSFPNDRKIEHLAVLAQGGPLPAAGRAVEWASSDVVAYAPEKCATARCVDERGATVAYAKCYAGDDGRRAYDVYRALSGPAARPGLSLPRALGYSEPCRTLLLEPLSGRRISELAGADLAAGCRHLGAAVAALHSTEAPLQLPDFRRLSPGAVETAAGLIGRARPDAAPLAAAIARELAARWRRPDAPPVCLHGDVHPKNGLLRTGGVALVDLDQASLGPAAADIGSLLAGLRYCGQLGLLARATGRELARAFLDGYAASRPLPPDGEIRWHTSAALLAERALRAVNRIRLPGLLRLREILGDARQLLTPGGDL